MRVQSTIGMGIGPSTFSEGGGGGLSSEATLPKIIPSNALF